MLWLSYARFYFSFGATFTLCILLFAICIFVIFVIFHFGFDDSSLVLIKPVLFTSHFCQRAASQYSFHFLILNMYFRRSSSCGGFRIRHAQNSHSIAFCLIVFLFFLFL